MFAVTLVGLLAGFCTTISFLPQVLKTWRTRSTEDISLGMFRPFHYGGVGGIEIRWILSLRGLLRGTMNVAAVVLGERELRPLPVGHCF